MSALERCRHAVVLQSASFDAAQKKKKKKKGGTTNVFLSRARKINFTRRKIADVVAACQRDFSRTRIVEKG